MALTRGSSALTDAENTTLTKDLAQAAKVVYPNTVTLQMFGAQLAAVTIDDSPDYSLTEVRAASGQNWLLDTDSMDLAAFYMAQTYLDARGGGTIVFHDIGRTYEFSRCAFVHSNIRVDLNGCRVKSTASFSSTSPTNFARSDRVFVFGILAREDLPRFTAQGFYQTANSIGVTAHDVTNVSGAGWEVGDIALVRTTAEDVTDPTRPLPTSTTFNRVTGVSGTTLTFQYSFEQAIAAPLLLNYNKIGITKQSLAANGEPHVYYCAYNAEVVDGTIEGGQSLAFETNGALACTIDVLVDGPLSPAASGNAVVRSLVNIRPGSVWGGSKGCVEWGFGSALTHTRVHAGFSGKLDVAFTAGDYYIYQDGENIFGMSSEGVIDVGGRASNNLLNSFSTRCKYDLKILNGAAVNAGVSDIGTGNVIRGEYHAGTPNYLSRLKGSKSFLSAKLYGTPSTTIAIWVEASSAAIITSETWCESGKLQFAGSTSGNVVTGPYIPDGVTSAGFQSNNAISYINSLGSFPDAMDMSVHTASGLLTTTEFYYGRTMHNFGATASVTMTASIPSKPGMTIRLARTAPHAFRFKPFGTEIIGNGGAGKYVELASDDAYLELRCIRAGKWVVAHSVGTIAYEA